MPDQVKCSVTNCIYWEDKLCTASAIEVNVDGGGTLSQNEADTKCHTFEERN